MARWPRKKAAVLFGHLLLCRAPVSSKDLASAFFYDELAQVHTHVYNFRQVTAAVSGRDLIVSKDGSYSIARDQIAYCDLWVFERYFEKARALELRGLLEVARALYQVAVSVVDGPLFSDLGNELAEVRATFAGQIDHARRLLAT